MNFKFWLAVALTVLALGLGIANWAQLYGVYADVDSRLDRAQLSPSPKQMADRLDEIIQRMEGYGMTSGHAALIFKNPVNDVGLDYQTIKSIRDRARQLQEEPVTSVVYQTALKDMRDTLTNLKIDGWYWYALRSPMFWVFWALVVIAAVVWIAWLMNPY
jgi:hypothetical protein